MSVEELPFETPQGWAWARLGSLGVFMGGGTPSKADPSLWHGQLPWVSPKDMKRSRIVDSIDHVSVEALSRSAVRLIPEGSLLMVVRGMILAKAFPVAVAERQLTINQDMKALALADRELNGFLLLALRAWEPQVLRLVERSTHGTCRLESELLATLPLPLPPLAEQRRILTKVVELLTLCDSLESRLSQARAASTRLAAAIVHRAAAA